MPKAQKTPYSILELDIVGIDSQHQEVFKNSLDLAQKAEELGYHRFWLAEHHNMINIASSATPVLIGHIASGTEKIRVGSGGVMLPNHTPLIVAEQFGTLGSLYPDRIDLGLGRAPGTDQTTAHEIRPDRDRAVRGFPEEVGKIQNYFSPDNEKAKVRAPIAEGVNVPIYILGSSTDSARLAAQKGLPYAFASHFAPAQLFQALRIYRDEFQPSEHCQKPYIIGCINVIAADSDEEAERLSTSMVRMMVGVLTGRMEYIHPPFEPGPEIRELLQNPALQQMLKYAFIGSKETVKAHTADFLEQTGVDELMVATHVYEHEDRVKSYRLFSELMQELQVERQASPTGD